jgi:hypothetical protein
MPLPEAQEQLTEEQQREAEAAQEAAFVEGFDAPEDEDSPAQTPEPKVDTPPEPQATDPESKVETQPLTAEQVRQELEILREATAADIRKVFGKLGEVGSIVQELRKPRQAGPVKLPEGSFKRMTEEFPEMTKYLQDDLAEVLSQLGGAPAAIDADTITQALNPRFEETLSEVDKRVERRLLRRDHPDWDKVTKSPEFADWKAKVLPPEEAAVLDESWDADFIGGKLTDFKAWKAAKEAKAAERQQRLDAAITPTHGRREVPLEEPADVEDAFLEGFNGR